MDGNKEPLLLILHIYVHLYVFQLVLQVCSLGLQKVRLVQCVLKSLCQSEDVALLHVQLLLQFCLLRKKVTHDTHWLC